MSDTPPKADVVLPWRHGPDVGRHRGNSRGNRNPRRSDFIGRCEHEHRPAHWPTDAGYRAGRADLLPGFNDAHAHMEREGLKRLRTSLAGARSIREITRRIAAAGREVPSGEWIVTMPVGEPPFFFGGPELLAEKRMPDCRELDAADRIIPCAYLACLEIGAVHLATQRSTLWR